MFNVNVTISLSAETLATLAVILNANRVQPAAQETKTEATPTVQTDKTEKAPAKSGGAGKAPKEEAPKSPAFSDLADEAKIEAIKAEVTKHTKKGKSADMRTLLTFIGAGKVSELQGEDIDTFMTLVQRYGEGEDIETLTSLD